MNLNLDDRIVASLPSEQELETYFDRLWPICRSITGEGFRSSLKIITELCPYISLKFASGTQVFDWTIPDEWNIEDAWVEDEAHRRVIDYKKHNLHIVSYSVPVDKWMTLEELKKNLHTLPFQPDAIPYVTSYYEKRWGFCQSFNEIEKLRPGNYRAVIRSTLEPGTLDIGHCVLPSTEGSKEEFLVSSYLCHPSMANNELSGPLVSAFLYRILKAFPSRRFNYRFVVGPETIGSIAYLSEFGRQLKSNCIGGIIANLCASRDPLIYKSTKDGNSALDRVAVNVLKHSSQPYEIMDFFPAGSDERQYGSPGFNLPVALLLRSHWKRSPEYHTSLDNKSFISFKTMRETIETYINIILALESNHKYRSTVLHGEPQLGRRGVYSTLGAKERPRQREQMMGLINLADGETSLIDVADRIDSSILDLVPVAETLLAKGLLEKI